MRNSKPLTILFVANGVSGFAQGITMLSIPWYFTQTNQPSLFIACFGAITLGSLFWGLYAGALVDGFNRKDVFLGTNFIEGLIILSVSSLGFKEGILPTGLIILVFTITFFGYHIHYPNLYAFAQEITDPKDYTKVTSNIEVVGQSTSIGSAALGAILLAGIDTSVSLPFIGDIPIVINKWSLHEIFLMDGISYIISFVMILFITHKPVRDVTHHADDEGDLKERLRSGYLYLKNHRLVSVFGICAYSIFIIVLVEMFSLRPIYVKMHLQADADVLGVSELIYATGSLISGFIISRILSRMPIPRSIIILTFLTAFAFIMCAFTNSAFMFYPICLLIGFTNAGSRIFRVSYLFNLIPNELAGRVNSIFNVAATMFRIFFISIFCFPFFSQGSNIVYAYVILGSFTFVAGVILMILYPKILKLTEPVAEPEAVTH
ncbi:MAG: MFS transporter [Cytophagaceae bacterium]